LDIGQGLGTLSGRVFDVVLAVGILEFVPDLQAVIRSLRNVLRTAGLICFTFELYLPDHELQGKRSAETGEGAQQQLKDTSFLTYRRTFDEVETLLRGIGFRIISKSDFIAYLKSSKLVPISYGIVLAPL
jgi:SAM-dependent methyltransferase